MLIKNILQVNILETARPRMSESGSFALQLWNLLSSGNADDTFDEQAATIPRAC